MRRGPLIAALAAALLIWGLVFIPLKYLTNPAYTDHPVSPEGFLVLRFVPLLPLLLVLLVRHGKRQDWSALRRDWPWFVALGFFVIPGYHLPFNLALRTPIHTGLMSLILNLNPVQTYFLAVAFRQERPRRERTAGVFLAFAGLALIFGYELAQDIGGGESVLFSWEGAGWVLVSALSWTFYTLIGRRLAKDHDPHFIFAASGTAGTLAVLALAPLFFLTGRASFGEFLSLGPVDWALWAYVSIFSSFLAYWVWILALERLEASRLAGTGNLIPLIVHAASALFLPGERKAFTPIYLLGAAITLLGTALVLRKGRDAGGRGSGDQ